MLCMVYSKVGYGVVQYLYYISKDWCLSEILYMELNYMTVTSIINRICCLTAS